MARDPRELLARLRDEPSGRVIFVSHCLLNENTRYAGGAFRPGVVSELVSELARRGWGIYQMPCPEERAWGGVLKRRVLMAYDSKGSLLYRFRASPASSVSSAIHGSCTGGSRAKWLGTSPTISAHSSRFIGVVGVSASPSCGVTTSLDLKKSFEVLASCPLAQLNRAVMNERAVVGCTTAGEGLFVQALKRQLDHRGLSVAFFEHDLLAEMRGQPQTIAGMTSAASK